MVETAVNLVKGQNIDLTKTNPGLSEINVGLGWDVNSNGGAAFDLDAIAFLTKADGKVSTNSNICYFGNKTVANGAVIHSGDNLTGAGDGDDEQIVVDLTKIPADVEKVVFAVQIYENDSRGQNFGQVNNAFIRLVDKATNTELAKYDLTEDYSVESAVVMGEVYRKDGEFKFKALGQGKTTTIKQLMSEFGAV